MFFRPTDIPFDADDAHRFLPWLIGVMAGLATLFLCLGISLNHWVVDRHVNVSGGFTVNIPAGPDQTAQVKKVREHLKTLPGLGKISEADSVEVKKLLAPWLGNRPMDDLPLPAIIEVELADPDAPADYAGLQKELFAIAPGVEVDSRERWVDAFSRFSFAVRWLSAILAVLIIGSMAMTIAFASRAALRLHSRTVRLLHAIGAEDGYILRQFLQEAVRLTLPGAAAGAATAGLLYWGLGAYVHSVQISMLPPLAMTGWHISLLFLVPIGCSFAAWLVARFSISMQLQRVL